MKTGTIHQTHNETPSPISIPFDYNMSIYPKIVNVMQGNDVKVNVSITYLQGFPENITLSADSIPPNANYTFTKLATGLTSNDTLNTILTIHISNIVAPNSYNVTINSRADGGKTCCTLCNLSVTSSKVTVSGTVTTNRGRIPTQITFKLLWKPNADLQTFTDPIESGNYDICLPNGEFFGVSVDWRNPDGTSGTQYFIQPFGTISGQNPIFCPFSWEDYS